jgi:hypothetical protein
MSVPDEPVKPNEINGVCHHRFGGSRYRAASAAGFATVENRNG